MKLEIFRNISNSPFPKGSTALAGGDLNPPARRATSFTKGGIILWIPALLAGMTIIFVVVPQAHASGLFKSPPNNMGLIGLWNFNEGAGTSVADASGGGNTGTWNGTGSHWASGKFSNGGSFDGTDDYVSVGSQSFGDTVTISAWVKPAVTNAYQTIVGVCDDPNSACTGQDYAYLELRLDNNGAITATYSPTTYFTRRIAATTNSGSLFTGGQWSYVTATYNCSGNTIALYLNGTVQASTANNASSGSCSKSFAPFIGATRDIFGSSHLQYFSGSIDDVRIYNRALSVAEVATLYNSTGAGKVGTLAKNAVSSTGLVGYWPGDSVDVRGTTAYDRSGSGNNGTLTNGASTTDGFLGRAFSFDGTDDYVDVATSSALFVGTGDFTLSEWIKTTSAGNKMSLSVGSDSTGHLVYFWEGSAGGFEFGRYGAGTGLRFSNSLIRDGLWHHILGTRSGDTGKLYLDGVLMATDSGWSAANITAGYLNIGRFAAGNYFSGQIDDVRMYNRALSAAEVKNLYNIRPTKVNSLRNNPTSNLQNGLVGWWPFDGQYLTTTTATDISGSGNNGTLTNGPTTAIGKLGQALRFDGVDDYVEIASVPVFEMTDFSASFWVKTADTVGYMLSFGKADVPTYTGWHVLLSTYGQLGYFAGKSAAPGYDNLASVGSINTNTWRFATVVKSGASLTFYIDGVGETPQTVDSSVLYNSGLRNFRIGKITGSTSDAYDLQGSIDDVRIYNRALSAAEVAQLYRMGK